MRILFYGDGDWAANSLQRLVDDGHTICAVVIRRKPSDTSFQQVAEKNEIKILQPKSINSEEFHEIVKQLDVELNLSVSYNQIFKKTIINLPLRKTINFHAGKLPYYRGRNIINWAIINGETEIAITGHYIDEGIDTGDIIYQKTIPLEWTSTYGDMLEKAVNEMPDVVSTTVNLIETGKFKVIKQSHRQGTYFSKRGEGDEWIDWSDTSFNIYNKIRAITTPGPGARTTLDNKQVIIWSAEYDKDWNKYIATPGQVVGIKKGKGVYIKTGDSVILLKIIQYDNNEPCVADLKMGQKLGMNIYSILQDMQKRIIELESKLNIKSD